MNARTTTLLIVLALALAACVAPIQAPPVKLPQQPKTEQALPFQSEPAQNKLPVQSQPQAADTMQQPKAPDTRAQPAEMLPELSATVPKSPEVQAMDDLLKPEEVLPASQMPVRDQWYLEEQSPATAPAMDPYWDNFFKNLERGA